LGIIYYAATITADKKSENFEKKKKKKRKRRVRQETERKRFVSETNGDFPFICRWQSNGLRQCNNNKRSIFFPHYFLSLVS
jgi:hypothetical protein